MQLLLVVICISWVVLAVIVDIVPYIPATVAGVEMLPSLALTWILFEQVRNLGKGRTVEQRSVLGRTGTDREFRFGTLIDWFISGKPESMTNLDAEVDEDALESGLAFAAPEPWRLEDGCVNAFLGIWLGKSLSSHERLKREVLQWHLPR